MNQEESPGRTGTPRARPKVLLGVTAAQSLGLLADVSRRLAESGAEVHVVSSPSAGGTAFLHPRVVHHAVEMQREPSPLKDLKSLLEMRRLMRSLRPDVVVMGTPKASLLGLTSAWLERVPRRVYQLRGLRLETERGWRRSLLKALERVTFLASTDAVAVSESLRKEVRAQKLTCGRGVEVLGAGSSKGVDADRFKPWDKDEDGRQTKLGWGLRPEVPVVGFVGRLTADKGVGDLLQASEILRRRGVAHRLLLVGSVEDKTIASDVQRAVKSGTAVWGGSSSEIESVYHAMDVFCLPTLREGFPSVVLEASASALPVVTTTATGAVDSVVDGETGLLVPPSSPDRLAEALGALLADEKMRGRMGEAGRARVLEHFQKEDVEQRFVDYVLGAGERARPRAENREQGEQ